MQAFPGGRIQVSTEQVPQRYECHRRRQHGYLQWQEVSPDQPDGPRAQGKHDTGEDEQQGADAAATRANGSRLVAKSQYAVPPNSQEHSCVRLSSTARARSATTRSTTYPRPTQIPGTTTNQVRVKATGQ